jgi:uncharacterized protein (DUF924 family)
MSEQPAWVDDVLGFWFSELHEADWWTKSEALDAQIRTRFARLHERLTSGDLVDAGAGPRAMLATVIVLDQFSRNLHRGSARAYAADAMARRVARGALARGHDLNLGPAERLFLYMPFEHSEDRADQALAVERIAQLGRQDWTDFAIAHRALVDRFGRFPHRNAVLGRESTTDELAALAGPMGSF